MRSDPTPEPLLVDERTAARLLGISPRTMWDLNAHGEIPCVRVARNTKRYSVATLRAWIAERERRQEGGER